jgi:CDP-glycerol glycerophosphotransferase (TagB/SpsB family)
MSFKNTLGCWGDLDFFSNIVCLSEFHKELRKITMPGAESKIIITGYPRNDALFRKSDSARKIFKVDAEKKIVLWLPTFRHHADPNAKFSTKEGRCDYGNSGRQNEFNLLSEETLTKIDGALDGKKIFLLVKFHPSQNMEYVSRTKKFKNILELSSAEFVERGANLYQVLSDTDALIADFSSVYVDFLLRGKPIAFDITDLDDYSGGIGFTVKNPAEFMPGPLIHNERELSDFLQGVSEGKDEFSSAREKVCEKCHKFRDGNSTVRLLDFYGLGARK